MLSNHSHPPQKDTKTSDTVSLVLRCLAVLLLLLLFLHGHGWAQGFKASGNAVLVHFNGVPTGSCFSFNVAEDDTTGDFYDCLLGSWFKVNGTGGSGGVVPTGTGFTHITAGVQDGAAKTVDVSSADITGLLKASSFPALTGDGTTAGGALAFTLATVATPGTSPKVTFNAKGLVTSGTNLASGDIPNNAANTTGNAATATALATNPTDCSANQYADAIDASGNLTCAQVGYGQLTSVPTTFAPTAHALLSATHSDTTAAAPIRGDGLFAIGATPTWQRIAHPSTTGGYFKWNGTDEVASTGAASGTGACTNQFASTLNADAAPTCTSVTQATMAAGAINWAFCGTTNGAVNELTPVNAATCCNGTTCREFMIHYLIVGYSAGAVGRLLMGPGTPSTTAGTNGSGLREVTTATATDVSTAAVSIPGIPLAITVTAIARDGWIMIDGASGSLKSININGLEGNPSVSAAPTIFQGVGWFSDLSTNAPLQQFTLGVYATLATTALAATTFSAGTRLDVWGRNGN